MATAILFSSMKFSSRLMVNNTIYGELLIRKACPMSGAQPMSEASALAEASALGMVKLLMCISKSDGMVRQQNDSLKGY